MIYHGVPMMRIPGTPIEFIVNSTCFPACLLKYIVFATIRDMRKNHTIIISCKVAKIEKKARFLQLY